MDKTDIFDSHDYRRSRKAYYAQCVAEYFVSLMVTDAYLAKLLKYIGISDSLCGVISSLASFAFLFQLLSIPLMKAIKSIKKTVILYDSLSVIFFMATFLVPFIPVSSAIQTVLIFIFILGGYFGKYLVFSIYYKWSHSYVHPEKRGDFSAVNEMISLMSGVFFTLSVGFIIDTFENKNNLTGGFLFIAAIIFVLSIANFICLKLIAPDTPDEIAVQQKSVKEVLEKSLGNRNFVNVIIMTSLFDIARFFTLGFLGTFKTEDLMMSVETVQIINIVACLGRFVFSTPFGRYSDKTSFANGYCLSLRLAAASFLVNVFTGQSTWWLIIVHTVLINISYAGNSANSYNIAYSYVDEDYIIQAMAIKNCISGVLGFLASILGGKVLAYIQANGNSFLGITMYGQQLLSLISFLLTIATILFARLVVSKQKVMKQ